MEPLQSPDVRRFDKWGSTYDRSVFQRFFFMPIHARMLALMSADGLTRKPGRVVDVGCGTGRLLRAAALRWPEAELVGVDPAPMMISEATRLNPVASFVLGSAESLQLPDGSVDFVLSSLSFHHWSDQAKGLHEIARVLRPGGAFCLADHNFAVARLSGEKVRSRAELRSMLAGAGLGVLVQKGGGLPFLTLTLAGK